MSKILVINSKDRVNYNTTDSGSFRINFDQPLFDDNKPVKCKLSGIGIPKSFFNINTSNNTLTVFVDSLNDFFRL